MAFISNLLWFWIVMGTISSLAYWIPHLAKAENRARFTDEAIRDKMVRGERDPLKLRLADIFGSRLGLLVLMFACWPITLYVVLFGGKRT